MPELSPSDQEFISQLNAFVDENIANEQFGVTELADLMSMSRSNLLRKVKKITNLSVSQLIREIRLKKSMILLKTSGLNVSEVSLQVGFGSPSYFIKCFREYYGYPPGEVGQHDDGEVMPAVLTDDVEPAKKSKSILWIGLAAAVLVGTMTYFFWPFSKSSAFEKSIAVLPFKNDSNDSANIYMINGLMESTLNSLQKIKDLKVISRTSSEKYRNTSYSIPEMAEELNVKYFVEGSGQKIGDQILLNIQLIDGATDKHLWSKQYRRETKDIFALQQEIAKNIAEEIEVIITPEEEASIEKNPTADLVAYDYFLKARDISYKGGTKNLENAIQLYTKAIERDPKFALAYAEMAMLYYYLDAFQTEKVHTADINSNADKALLYDPKLPNSLVAKAAFYVHNKQYQLAVPYLEKALEYNPNSSLACGFLASVYNYYLPNTTKYIEYALRGARLDVTGIDSATTSINYLRLSDALLQNGFIDLSLKYANKSLEFDPNNFYSKWVKSFVLFAKTKDAKETKRLLIEELKKDTLSLVMLEEVGKVCYMMEDYDEAYYYYRKFIDLRESKRLDIFRHENLKVATVFAAKGKKEEADKLAESYRVFAEEDRSIYRELQIAAYHAYRNDDEKAMVHLKLFSKEENFQYWVLLMREDPSLRDIRKHPDFEKVMTTIEKRFWDNHHKLRKTLEEKGIL
ncbi:AraC family transcriptional regulator [Pseudochryseolinea flava]|uniref:AraC family transcriptional regulator n=2 Tax=Pseudochryseolinea flava TaxID=2059302 RepID=A0A364XYV3_9BACT|nr:AraC family transcriptional regulator [Pseudochryseolinea flava]